MFILWSLLILNWLIYNVLPICFRNENFAIDVLEELMAHYAIFHGFPIKDILMVIHILVVNPRVRKVQKYNMQLESTNILPFEVNRSKLQCYLFIYLHRILAITLTTRWWWNRYYCSTNTFRHTRIYLTEQCRLR